MALDFAGMSALAQVDNWGAIRAEKARELQIIAMRNAMAEKEVQQQAQAGAAIEQYLSTVDNIKVLEQDKKWIDQKNSELTKVIQEGIKKHNGNVKKYLYAGGLNELNKYKNNLLQSEEVATGLTNAYNMNKYMADTAAGLNPRMTSFELLDPSGAKQITGTFADNVKAFQEGKATKLNYRGAFATPTGDPRQFFGGVFGNEQKRPQSASAMDVAKFWTETAKQQGLSKQDAEQFGYMKGIEYQDALKKGLAPYQYKSEDQELKMLEKRKLRAQIGALTPQPQMNWLYSVATGGVAPDGKPVDKTNLNVREATFTMSADRSAALANTVNLPISKNGTITPENIIAKGKFLIGDKVLDLGGLLPEHIKGAVPTGKLVATEKLDGKGQRVYGMEVQITLNEPGIDNAMYGGDNIKNWYALYERQVPGAQKGGTVWGWDDETLTLNAVVPVPLTPQTFIDFNRKAQEISPSERGNVVTSFGQSDAMQVYLQMEDRYNRAYQNQQQSNK